MSSKSSRPRLTIEDMQNGGNQKVFDVIRNERDQKVLKKQVRYLKGLNLQHANFEYLKSLLLPLMNGYTMRTVTVPPGELVYRAVPWLDRPIDKKQLSYPPVEKVNIGRANNPEKPMFYGSVGCHSTIMELAPSQGDRLVISKWRTTHELVLISAGYTKNAFNGKAGMSRLKDIPWLKQLGTEYLPEKRCNQYVEELLAAEFTKRVSKGKEWEYKISAAVSELLLNGLSFGLGGAPAVELSGIVYPSTPNEVNVDNVALHCSFADKHLELISAQYVEIFKKSNDREYIIQGLDFSDSLSNEGVIQWKNSFPSQLIAGTDHTARYSREVMEIVDNKNVVVANVQPNQEGAYILSTLKFQEPNLHLSLLTNWPER